MDDMAITFSASLAYYTVFSAAPLILIAVAVGGIFFGNEASSGEIFGALRGLVGHEGAKAIEAMVEASALEDKGIVATVVGVLVLLLGATTLFGQLQDALNYIWKVRPKPGRAIRTLLRQRILSFSMILVLALLTLVSLLASAVLSGLDKFANEKLPGGEVLWHALNIGISFLFAAVIFAGVYRLLPDVKLRWRNVWTGGLITSFFFTLGKYLIGLYLGASAIGSTYGAAGSLVIILVWAYYSSAILLFGAEYTKAKTLRKEKTIHLKPGAEWMPKPMPETDEEKKSPPRLRPENPGDFAVRA